MGMDMDGLCGWLLILICDLALCGLSALDFMAGTENRMLVNGDVVRVYDPISI